MRGQPDAPAKKRPEEPDVGRIHQVDDDQDDIDDDVRQKVKFEALVLKGIMHFFSPFHRPPVRDDGIRRVALICGRAYDVVWFTQTALAGPILSELSHSPSVAIDIGQFRRLDR